MAMGSWLVGGDPALGSPTPKPPSSSKPRAGTPSRLAPSQRGAGGGGGVPARRGLGWGPGSWCSLACLGSRSWDPSHIPINGRFASGFAPEMLLSGGLHKKEREIASRKEECVFSKSLLRCVFAQAFCSQKPFREITLKYAKTR